MVQNIDDVLQRGVVMDGNDLKMIFILYLYINVRCLILTLRNNLISFITELYSKSNNLAAQSAQFRKDATSLNATSWVAIGAGLSVLFIVFFFWYKFLL